MTLDADAGKQRPIRGLRMPRCAACRMHELDCLCAQLPRLRNGTRVLVYVHAHELHRPSNTGWLLPRVLANAALVVHGSGERQGWTEPVTPAAWVLHPDGRELSTSDAAHCTTLLVPDGSWSQARRMLHRLPALRGGTLVRLPDRVSGGAADLSLRRKPRRDLVGTYEAVARALGVLETRELEEGMIAVLRRVVERVRHRRRFPHAAVPAPDSGM